jgi:hypothetical protein
VIKWRQVEVKVTGLPIEDMLAEDCALVSKQCVGEE